MGWDYEPVDPAPPAGRYTAVAVGFQHACALTAGADAVCWAWPSRRYKDEDLERSVYENQLTKPPPGPFVAISSSDFRSCAVTADGGVVCWGDVEYSELPQWVAIE